MSVLDVLGFLCTPFSIVVGGALAITLIVEVLLTFAPLPRPTVEPLPRAFARAPHHGDHA